MGGNKIRVAATGAALVLAMALSACGSSDDGKDDDSSGQPVATPTPTNEGAVTEGSGEGMKVGYISLGDSLPFVKIVSDGIKKAADEAGVELLFCDSQLDAAKALECARTFKTQQVQGILNFQLDEGAAEQICAAGPDVPVIAIDIHQAPCEVSFMGANNEQAGITNGEGLGTYFKSEFNCEYDAFVSLEVPAAGAVTKLRSDSAIKGFENICGPIPEDKMRHVAAEGTTDNGRQVFADTLTALPDAKRIAVTSVNDDIALGVLAAAKAQGREGDIWMASSGADPTSWTGIRENPNWIGDSAYFPEGYGNIGIPAIIKLINGEDVPAELLTEHVFISKDNIDEYYPQ